MTRRILVAYLLLTAMVLVTLTVPLGLTFGARERERLLTSIERDGRVLAGEVDDAFETGDLGAVPGIVDDYVRQTGGRVVIVDADGRSVIDSSDPSGGPRDFSTRPEIAAALDGAFTSGDRDSTTLGESLSFVAVPIRHEGGVLGAVRVSYPTTTVDARTRSVWVRLATLGVTALAIAAVAGWIVARTLARPVTDLERAAESLAAGDLTARVPIGTGPPDLVRVAGSFNTMAERLQSLVESQRSFLADASHQLRTPLTALRLRIESLTDGRSATTDDVAAVRDEVDRLSGLVDALLAMARLDAQPGEVTDVVVGAIAAERVATWSPLADEHDVTLRLDDRSAGHPARAIAGGTEQILDNLISNAIEHSPAGTTVTVSVDLVGDGNTSALHLHVTDEGPGLTDAQMAKMFDRFWRGSSPSDGGSGLGLAIVRRLAEAAGGTASAERPPPGGLRVVVTLPTSADQTA